MVWSVYSLELVGSKQKRNIETCTSTRHPVQEFTSETAQKMLHVQTSGEPMCLNWHGQLFPSCVRVFRRVAQPFPSPVTITQQR